MSYVITHGKCRLQITHEYCVRKRQNNDFYYCRKRKRTEFVLGRCRGVDGFVQICGIFAMKGIHTRPRDYCGGMKTESM